MVSWGSDTMKMSTLSPVSGSEVAGSQITESIPSMGEKSGGTAVDIQSCNLAIQLTRKTVLSKVKWRFIDISNLMFHRGKRREGAFCRFEAFFALLRWLCCSIHAGKWCKSLLNVGVNIWMLIWLLTLYHAALVSLHLCLSVTEMQPGGTNKRRAFCKHMHMINVPTHIIHPCRCLLHYQKTKASQDAAFCRENTSLSHTPREYY